ncbi:hypothetical protein COV82_03125 [Candidatus Peregrinibacteria bacterium CG11_big_fil_rev_8_21_14_0_20_46_8]|nr:MAG: hypothetical protein COV82_03125 [Candidatus Peregrinibacteria bacterium CG11_big_fil_rev_8_21_14_0_20_46_8]
MYEIIAPPFTLEFRKMSTKELKQYYEWFMNEKPKRLKLLDEAIKSTKGFEKWNNDFSVDSLTSLGKWITATKKRKLLSGDLTNETFSHAIDAAMYFGDVLIRTNNNLTWHHNINTAKNDADYGQPVVTRNSKIPCNPVQLLVAFSYGLFEGTKKDTDLIKTFQYWDKSFRDS